jgi:hypothetical protein
MNEILIRTNKAEYVGGEKVYGIVYVCVHDPLDSKGLRLKVKGYEKCVWNYSYSEREGDEWVRRTGHKKDKKEFFRVDIRLMEYPGGFPVGYYSYPFQYALPPGLPGVFHFANDIGMKWSATVKYKIKAEVDIPGMKNDLKATQPLMVRQRTKCQDPEPQVYTEQGKVHTFCCIPRGDVNVIARLDKTAYRAGQEAEIAVDIDNQSSVDIEHFAVKLTRVVKLKGNDPHRHDDGKDVHCILDMIRENSYDGCRSGSHNSKKIPLELWTNQDGKQVELQPETNGSVVKVFCFLSVSLLSKICPNSQVPNSVLV